MILITLTALLLAAPPAKAPATGTAKKNSTMKAMIKEVTATATTADDGGVQLVNGLDVSKMPFTPESIKQVVVSYQPQIQSCYEETLAVKDNAPEGVLKTSFVITADGLVKSAKVNKQTSTLKDNRLHDCVVAVVSSMSFPKPPDEKDHPIDFPFNLKAIH